MKHKTSTMHSRPPHTNYTDAYPTANGFHSNGANACHQNGVAAHNGGFYGPISPVGRGGSSTSTNSTPSPCGSFPGFPSPAMTDFANNGLSRMPRSGSKAQQQQQQNSISTFDQFVQDLCEDSLFQQSHNPGAATTAAAASFHSNANFHNSNNSSNSNVNVSCVDNGSGVMSSSNVSSGVNVSQSSVPPPTSSTGHNNISSSRESLSQSSQFECGMSPFHAPNSVWNCPRYPQLSSASSASNANVPNPFMPSFTNMASRVGAN